MAGAVAVAVAGAVAGAVAAAAAGAVTGAVAGAAGGNSFRKTIGSQVRLIITGSLDCRLDKKARTYIYISVRAFYYGAPKEP